MRSVVAYIGVGSNIGDRKANIERAIKIMSLIRGLKLLKVSTMYETDPVGGPEQGKFLNGALKLRTSMSAPRLLGHMKEIEKIIGRKRTVRNGPRIIDLDILLFGNKKIKTGDLMIPHPRMQKREFVLRPLRELV